jgi:hypothetical protein
MWNRGGHVRCEGVAREGAYNANLSRRRLEVVDVPPSRIAWGKGWYRQLSATMSRHLDMVYFQ